MGERVRAGELDIWTEQVGEGPDVLLIGGAGDTVESWQFQLEGLRDRWSHVGGDFSDSEALEAAGLRE
jgi:hypothetical protein